MSSYPDMYNTQAAQLIQRCVIVQRDERGYGLTVTGDNPVFVQSVKDNGAAHRAGVQTGDRIIKVNGTLVTSSNHVEVVKMIKSGSFVALTLLGRPPGAPSSTPPQSGSSLTPGPGINRHSESRRTVTSPQPANSQQDAQAKTERLNTFKRMLEQERNLLDHTERQYTLNPSEKLQKDINGIKTRISVLEKQLQKAASSMLSSKPASPNQPTTPVTPSSLPNTSVLEGHMAANNAALPLDHTNMNEEFQPIMEELPQGVRHERQRSSPETYGRASNQAADSTNSPTPGLKRNNSDVQSKEAARLKYASKVEPLERGKKQKRNDYQAIGRTKSLPGDALEPEPDEADSSGASPPPKMMAGMESVTPMEGVEEASILSSDSRVMSDPAAIPQLQMATVNTVELFSAPTVAEVPVHSVQAPGPPQKGIMCMDEDDFQSDNEAPPVSAPELFEEHGPFNELEQLEKKPAHMAVFLHYLISNSDPYPLFFYLVTDAYANGNLKEMKKWVYDIFSTFLGSQGPLRIQMKEEIVSAIENTINNHQSNEEAMRNLFHTARAEAKEEVEELLADFRQKRALGLGSIFGDQYLTNDDMDRNQELKIVESTLLPHLDRLTTIEAEKEQKNVALAAALTTFMKQVGVKVQNNSALERAPSFMAKDKRSLKFPRSGASKKLHIKGHQFVENQFLHTTFCSQCNGLLWGIGYQGYQCQYCEFAVHKTGPCLDKVTLECPGKKKGEGKNRNKRLTKIVGGGAKLVKEEAPKQPSHQVPTPLSPTPNVIQLKPENEELAELKKDIDVHSIVKSYETKQDNLAGSRSSIADSGISTQDSTTGSVTSGEEREVVEKTKKNFIKRSASLKSKGEEKKDGRRPSDRRSRSDVDMDGQIVVSALSTSHTSSSSSLSTKSQDSPRASLEQLRVDDPDDSDMEAEASTPNWQKMIDKDIVKKLKPKEVKRQEVINELFHTEKTHVRNLKVLRRVFFNPMMEQEVLPSQTILYIFPNIDEMIEVHGSLNAAMKKDRKTSHIITEVGQMLLDRFEGEAGETMKRVCATFCQNQSIALEHLKKLIKKEKEKERDKKEGSLSRFMDDAEANTLCRRLPLPGIIATGYQRLTKYPLLIENLLKYTSPKGTDYHKLERALTECKQILAYVNQAVKDSENRFRLLDYNMRMDKTPLEKSNNPLVVDYKNFDLSQHKLIHDGLLTWKANRNKSLEMQVLLLEDMIVLLQKQDEKLILKCHSTTNPAKEELKTHSPIITLQTVLCRPVATNKKAFFLVSTSSAAGPQIYELVTSSTQERQTWMDVILATQETEKKQPKDKRRMGRVTTTQRPLPPDLHAVYEEESKSEDKPEIHNPPTVVQSDTIITQPPEVVTQSVLGADSNTKPLELEATGDIRAALEQSIKQVPVEETSLSDKLQSLTLLANRIKPVLDEAVAEAPSNQILMEALEQLTKQLTVVTEQNQTQEEETEKMKLENRTLQENCEELANKQQQLKQELTVARHELNSLQPQGEGMPSQPGAGSLDSIPTAYEEEGLTAKEANRRSYSGDSSTTDSEDSRTMESSEPEEPTVVHDVEGRSLDGHESDTGPTSAPSSGEVTQPEVYVASPQVVTPVVNEQLLELQSAATQIENDVAQDEMKSENDVIAEEETKLENVIVDQEKTKSESDVITQDDTKSGDELEIAQLLDSIKEELPRVDGNEVMNGDVDSKVEETVEDVGCHGDSSDTIDAGIVVDEDVEEEEGEVNDASQSENVDTLLAVDINSNPDDILITESSHDHQELIQEQAQMEQTSSDTLVPSYDSDDSPSITPGGDATDLQQVDSKSQSLDDVPTLDSSVPDETNSEPCHIEVVDNKVETSSDLITNLEKSDEKTDLGGESEKKEMIESLEKSDVIPTDPTTPEQTRLETPEAGSRPASMISVDSASSDAFVNAQTEESDEVDNTPAVEQKSQESSPSTPSIIQATDPEMV